MYIFFLGPYVQLYLFRPEGLGIGIGWVAIAETPGPDLQRSPRRPN